MLGDLYWPRAVSLPPHGFHFHCPLHTLWRISLEVILERPVEHALVVCGLIIHVMLTQILLSELVHPSVPPQAVFSGSIEEEEEASV